MDYCTLAWLKSMAGSTQNGEDALLGSCISATSRRMDGYLSGRAEAVDYLKRESVAGELNQAVPDNRGRLMLWPWKPRIYSVSALSYMTSPSAGYIDLDPGQILVKSPTVFWYGTPTGDRDAVIVKISYDGGLAVDTEHLPENIQTACAIWAIRLYRQARSGMTDAIGVAELGTISYTLPTPKEVMGLLQPYKRVVTNG